MWDATQYLRYGDERARPFLDLIARVGADAPTYVADLGCGPGNLTALLARRWPGATVVGVDSSPEMIQAASARPESPAFQLGDVRDWRPAQRPDVITCNAVLQWVPDHHDLVAGWADMLAPDGWLAFQLPGNFSSPSHVIVKELAASPRWRALLADAELNRQAGDPGDYVDLLARPGYTVDAWETTYHHILPGDNAVLEWTKGTTLRPVLALLDPEQAASFIADYADRLRGAYKQGPFGTVLPFRRVFTVAHRVPGAATQPAKPAQEPASEPAR
ncbi:MAG TPA: trans-aconitate 2-methyltransferase [Trebonia sp.]|nr:trans-aconitate 2-methyltransferase [Trebonia sp.]